MTAQEEGTAWVRRRLAHPEVRKHWAINPEFVGCAVRYLEKVQQQEQATKSLGDPGSKWKDADFQIARALAKKRLRERTWESRCAYIAVIAAGLILGKLLFEVVTNLANRYSLSPSALFVPLFLATLALGATTQLELDVARKRRERWAAVYEFLMATLSNKARAVAKREARRVAGALARQRVAPNLQGANPGATPGEPYEAQEEAARLAQRGGEGR